MLDAVALDEGSIFRIGEKASKGLFDRLALFPLLARKTHQGIVARRSRGLISFVSVIAGPILAPGCFVRGHQHPAVLGAGRVFAERYLPGFARLALRIGPLLKFEEPFPFRQSARV